MVSTNSILIYRPRNNKGDSLIAEDENFAVVYNGSVGGTYEVMLKFTEQEIRDISGVTVSILPERR